MQLFLVHRVGPIIPKYYYVTKENVEAEKASPGKQDRVASDEDAEMDNIYLWGQSVYIISQLLSQFIELFRFICVVVASATVSTEASSKARQMHSSLVFVTESEIRLLCACSRAIFSWLEGVKGTATRP